MRDFGSCAVLGAGAGGQAIAADLSLAGVDVNLYEMPLFLENLQPIIDRGGIDIKGKGRQGFAKVRMATTEIEQAISGVDFLFVATQAIAHETIAQSCAPYLEDGQTIILFSGSGGSLQIARTLQELKVNKRVYIGETVTLPYVCTLRGPAEVEVLATVGPKNYFSAFPARDTDRIIDNLKGVYPALCRATNVLEAGLLNPNIVKHPMILFSLSRMESSKEPFCLNRQGMTPSVWKIFQQVDGEKMSILRKLGLNALSYWELFSSILLISHDDFAALLPEFNITTRHRFFTEDIPIGMVLLSSLGDKIGVETPTIDSIIHLVSVINNVDYYEQGRTIEKLGISGMDIESLNRFLGEGRVI